MGIRGQPWRGLLRPGGTDEKGKGREVKEKKMDSGQAFSRLRLAIRLRLVPKAVMRVSLHKSPVAPAMKVRS